MTESAQVLVVGIDHGLELVVQLVWVLDRAGRLLYKVDDHALGPADQLDQVVRYKGSYIHGDCSRTQDPLEQGRVQRREVFRPETCLDAQPNLAKRASLIEHGIATTVPLQNN